MLYKISISIDAGFDGVDNIADVIVGDVGACRKADAGGEEGFAHTVDVGGGVAVDRLLVHGLPKGAGLDVGLVEIDAQGFDIVVGLTVGCSC